MFVLTLLVHLGLEGFWQGLVKEREARPMRKDRDREIIVFRIVF